MQISALAQNTYIYLHLFLFAPVFKWVYLVVTYDGVIVRMFVNAELVAQVFGRY